jgi:T-complex protein 1 subunit gamma
VRSVAVWELRQPTNTTADTQTPGGERQFGRKAQLSNITAAKTVADIIRSCLGPKAMLKMLLDPMGGIVLTNDGHAILREIEVAHPAAKSMIELSRTQDEEVGDGTTTVIILGIERTESEVVVSDK